MNKKLFTLFLFSLGIVACIYVFVSLSGFSTSQDVNLVADPSSDVTSLEIREYSPEKLCLEGDTQDILTSGAALYENNCIYCHKMKNEGKMNLLSLSKTADRLGRDHVFEIVKNGRGKMPVYGSVLSDCEIEILFAYLEKWEKENEEMKN